MKTMWVTCCNFKRLPNASMEQGIAIGFEPGVSDIECIIDANGQKILPYEYWLWPFRGSFTTILETETKT